MFSYLIRAGPRELRLAFPAWVPPLTARAAPLGPRCRVGNKTSWVSRFGHLQADRLPEFAVPARALRAASVTELRQIASIVVRKAATYAQISCRCFVFMPRPGALSL